MRCREAAHEETKRKAQQRRAQQIQPAVRELLDLLAEELAAEYIRLTKADPTGKRSEEG
jgi:hypothetical protein